MKYYRVNPVFDNRQVVNKNRELVTLLGRELLTLREISSAYKVNPEWFIARFCDEVNFSRKQVVFLFGVRVLPWEEIGHCTFNDLDLERLKQATSHKEAQA